MSLRPHLDPSIAPASSEPFGVERLERMLVCVDDLPADAGVGRIAAVVAKACGVRRVRVVRVGGRHGSSDGDGRPPAIGADSPPSLEHFVGASLPFERSVEIVCDDMRRLHPAEVARLAGEDGIDLFVVGRGRPDGPEGGSGTGRLLARASPCSILVVPGSARPEIRRVLVWIRGDAESCGLAARTACRVAGAAGGSVEGLHVFPVGGGYSRTGVTLAEHVSLLGRAAAREVQGLLSRPAIGAPTLAVRCVPDLYSQPARVVLDELERVNADLLVVGARGETAAAELLLGQATRFLVSRSPRPVLVVRRKGERVGLLRALASLL